MPKRMTQEEFEAKVAEYGLVKVIGEYKGGYKPIRYQCLFCNKEWTTKASNIMYGRGCPECGAKRSVSKRTMTHEQFVSMMAEKNPDVEVTGRYCNSSTKIKVRCKKCNYEWEQTPNNLSTKLSGCPNCRYDKVALKLKKAQEDFIKELVEVHPTIELVGEYKNNKTRTKFRCAVCGCEWLTDPHSVVNGQQSGCPHCKKSKGENAIKDFLKENKIQFETQKAFQNCKHKRLLKFDFYLPDYNLCIEYQGAQHYKSVDYFGGIEGFEESQIRDNIKRKFCETNNILLLEIPYTKFNHIAEILSDTIKCREEKLLNKEIEEVA